MADRLWLCHTPQMMVAIQVEEDSGDVVTAMVAKKWPNFKQGQQAPRKGGKSRGLCRAHQKHGEDCYRYANKKNCTWSGN